MDDSHRSQPSKFALSGDVPNPLRPYYIPPSVGTPAGSSTTTSQAGLGHANKSSTTGIRPSFGTAARDLLSDIDYGEYIKPSSSSVSASTSSFQSTSVADAAKRLADQAIWKYTSVFLAQPFDVAKTILQCHHAGAITRMNRKAAYSRDVPEGRFEGSEFGRGGKMYGYASDEDSDLGSPSYFTSGAPSQSSYSIKSPSKSRHRYDTYPEQDVSAGSSSRIRSHFDDSQHRQHRHPQQQEVPPYKLELHRFDSITEVLAQLWSKEGVWGLWKGTDATFIYGILFRTMETWARGLLSAVFNLPDSSVVSAAVGVNTFRGSTGALGLNVAESGSPMVSLAIVIAASGIAGFLLAPLDIVRTRLILTPLNHQPRSIIPSLRYFQTYTCPLKIVPITLLHSMIPSLFTASAPLILRSTLGVDPILTPVTYSIASFLSSIMELSVRLPCETILRRGQIDVARVSHDKQQKHHQQQEQETRYSFNNRNSKTPPPILPPTNLSRSQSRAYSYSRSRSRTPSPSAMPAVPTEPHSLPTIITTGSYNGIFGTVWAIQREARNGTDPSLSSRQQQLQYQRFTRMKKVDDGSASSGLLQSIGLWRGWRVGFWGLVGVWGAAACGGGNSSGVGVEF